MATSSCSVCAGAQLLEAEESFACPTCGRTMRRMEPAVGASGPVFHCVAHCSTLFPSSSMLAAARAVRN